MNILRELAARAKGGLDDDTLDVIVSSASGSETLHFRIRKRAVVAILASLALLVLVMIALVFSAGSLLRQVARAKVATAENVELRRQLLRLAELENQLDHIESTRKALLQIAGVEDRGSVPGIEVPMPEDSATTLAYGWAEPESSLSEVAIRDIAQTLGQEPIDGARSRAFGETSENGIIHTGIDLASETGTVVHAAGSGVVSFVGDDPTLGQVVVISHGPDLETLYGHNSRILVRPGDTVAEGQPIAEVGSTGLSSGPHLHFEIRWGGRSIDPASIFARYR